MGKHNRNVLGVPMVTSKSNHLLGRLTEFSHSAHGCDLLQLMDIRQISKREGAWGNDQGNQV